MQSEKNVELAQTAAFRTLQQAYPPGPRSRLTRLQQWLHKMLAGSVVPAHWLYPETRPLVSPEALASSRSRDAAQRHDKTLKLEIVSHCWNYSHYLAFQLGSLLAHPPGPDLHVTMTVFYSPEDAETTALLERIGRLDQTHISWNWQALPAPYLFRRSIGRNLAARHSAADWVWFTDCDETFQQGCLTGLRQQLGDCQAALVYPETEHRTEPMETSAFVVDYKADDWIEKISSLPLDQFHASKMTRATGPLQITRGDIARELGYCDAVHCYQQPEPRFAKAHEDRIFRWLLATPGTAVDIPGVYRIQHRVKGRHQASAFSQLRQRVRHARYRRVRHSAATSDKTRK